MDFNQLTSTAVLIFVANLLIEGGKTGWKSFKAHRANRQGTSLEIRRINLTEEESLEARQNRQFEKLEKQLTDAASEREKMLRQQGETSAQIKELGEAQDRLRRQHEREIGEINSKLINAELIARQYERDIKFILDEVGIAYWEADENGFVTATNQTFLDLSGLTPEQCQGEGWLEGICENDRAKVKFQWLSFIKNTDTQRPMTFTFCNKLTSKETSVRALGKAIYLEKQIVYKYTVRTRTVFRVE